MVDSLGGQAVQPRVYDADHWTDDELRAAAVAYRGMFERERSGKHFVKSAVVAELRSGPLADRSEASVSRRMHNISAVLDDLGMERIRTYAPLTHVGRNVRARLERIIRDAWGDDDAMQTAVLPGVPHVRVVSVGVIKQETFTIGGTDPRTARRVEHALVRRYVGFAEACLRTLVAHAYEGGLRCDVFDETLDVLIEAKADARRESARMALGQLLDYRRYERGVPGLAVLMPMRPAAPTLDFLTQNGVDVIWEQTPGSFADTAGGRFSQ